MNAPRGPQPSHTPRTPVVSPRVWLSALGAGVFAVLCVTTLQTGCNSKSAAPKRGPAAHSHAQNGLFDSVAENLERLEQFDTQQIFIQICDRLNQWNLQERPKVNWQTDPLLAGLPERFRKLIVVRTIDLPRFDYSDARYLEEAVWLRDISRNARADQFNDLAVAERLFDWVVRNIQLESDEAAAARAETNPHRPFHTLLLGTGTAAERAWLFMLLARQQGLDVVLLSAGEEGSPAAKNPLAGLLLDDQLHLFDCRLGMPIPGPGQKGIATLEQVKADDALLRQLDLDAEHRYPLESGDFQHVVAYVEASPLGLARRMALVESRLAGKHKLVLASPGANLVERLKKVPGISDAGLWIWPFEVALLQSKLGSDDMFTREMLVFQLTPDLFKGRSYYFKGSYTGDNGAKKYFLQSRHSDEFIERYKLPPEALQRVKKEDISKVEALQIVQFRRARQDAGYWLGMIQFQMQDYPAAVFFFDRGTLQDAPTGPWTAGAHYNLGRTYEAMGDVETAIAQYEADTTSPQSFGSRLRARHLRDRQATAEARPEAPAGP